MSFAVRLEHAIHLFKCAALVVSGKVMNKKTGNHSVKSGIRIPQGGGESFIPLDVPAMRFLTCDLQYLRITIQASDIRLRVGTFYHEGQYACTTAKIKYFHVWLNVCLGDQHAFEGLFAHDPFEQGIVSRREPFETESGNIT